MAEKIEERTGGCMTSSLTSREYRALQLWMVQKSQSPEFLDRAHEWRRLFAEAWGTFLLVLVAAGGEAVTLGMIVVAPGTGLCLGTGDPRNRGGALPAGHARRPRHDVDLCGKTAS